MLYKSISDFDYIVNLYVCFNSDIIATILNSNTSNVLVVNCNEYRLPFCVCMSCVKKIVVGCWSELQFCDDP